MEAEANRVALRYVAESTFGEVPSGPPKFKDLRYTGESLHLEQTFVRSNEIRSDRQTPSVTRVNLNAAGDISGEFSYGTYDDFLAAVLFAAAWGSSQAGTTATAFDMAGTITVADATNLSVGMWVKIEDAEDAENNGYYKITAIDTNELTVTPAPAATNAADGTAQCKKGTQQIVNGTTATSFAFEKEFTDLTNVFSLLTGIMYESMTMTVNTDGIITVSFTTLGKTETGQTATSGDGAPTAANSNPVMNAVDNVILILEGTEPTDLTEFSFTINNNLRGRRVIGTLGLRSIGAGSITPTGTANAYFESNATMAKFRGNQATNFALGFEDDAGNGYIIEFPEVKLTAGQTVAGGINTDVMQELTFEPYRDATENVTVRIVRFPAA